jgi:hypothetical protein
VNTFGGFEQADLPAGLGLYRGKVRDVLDLGERLVMTATDRISAFDRVLAEVPHKGEVLVQADRRHHSQSHSGRAHSAHSRSGQMQGAAGGGGRARLPDRLGLARLPEGP